MRKLVRKRQDSRALKLAKSTYEAVAREIEREAAVEIKEAEHKAAAAVAESEKKAKAHEQALSELQQKMDRQKRESDDRIKRLEADVWSYANTQIPTLKNELEVANAHIKQLQALVVNKTIFIESLTASLNQKIVDHESPPNQSQADAYRQLLRGE